MKSDTTTHDIDDNGKSSKRNGKSGDFILSKEYRAHIVSERTRNGLVVGQNKQKIENRTKIESERLFWISEISLSFDAVVFFHLKMSRFLVCLIIVVGAVLDSELMIYFLLTKHFSLSLNKICRFPERIPQ